MKLNLKKDLVIFDLETTGLSITECKIIQIAILKVFADGRPNELRKKYINPGFPIPKEVVEITGITDDMVKNEQSFRSYAKGIMTFIGDSDIATFNGNQFDIPILTEHMFDAGIEFDMTGRNVIDVKRIFHQMERRDLKAAYKFYTGEEMSGAHDAGNDCLATLTVLEKMLDYYKGVDYVDKHDEVIPEPVVNDMKALNDFTRDFDTLDFAGMVRVNKEGVIILNAGKKYRGQPLIHVFENDKSYYDWVMVKGDFTRDTRAVIKKIMDDHYKAQEQLKETKEVI